MTETYEDLISGLRETESADDVLVERCIAMLAALKGSGIEFGGPDFYSKIVAAKDDDPKISEWLGSLNPASEEMVGYLTMLTVRANTVTSKKGTTDE